jgi:hypothetical protein
MNNYMRLPGLPAGSRGNDSVPNTPVRGQGGFPAGTATLGLPRPIATASGSPFVYELFQKTFGTILDGTSQQVLAEPDGVRVYLTIRNPIASGNGPPPPTLLVNFNTDSADEEVADFALLAGEAISFEQVVPQNRIFLGAVAGQGNCDYVISYATRPGVYA